MTEREQERAAVVAWLRSTANNDNRLARKYGERRIYYAAERATVSAVARRQLADAIERGDHIGKE